MPFFKKTSKKFPLIRFVTVACYAARQKSRVRTPHARVLRLKVCFVDSQRMQNLPSLLQKFRLFFRQRGELRRVENLRFGERNLHFRKFARNLLEPLVLVGLRGEFIGAAERLLAKERIVSFAVRLGVNRLDHRVGKTTRILH